MNTFNIFVNKANRSFAVDFDALPAHVKTHIIEYGLKQKFNDSHASETDGEKAFGLTQNLLERLLAGELSKTRSQGSPVERELLSILVQIFRAKLGGKLVDIKAMEKEELLTGIAKALGKDKVKIVEHFTKIAEGNVKKRAEEQALLLSDLSID